jgi:hypothetical protein
MNTLTTWLMLALCLASCHANKDVMVYVVNQSSVPLLVAGPSQANLMLLPGQTQNFIAGETTDANIYRWCPTTANSEYTRVRGEACAPARLSPNALQVMYVKASNPWVGVPRMQVWGYSATYSYPYMASQGEFGLNEWQTTDCSASNNGLGFQASCFRGPDDGNKNMYLYIKNPPAACFGKACPAADVDAGIQNLCNFNAPV